MAVGRDEPVLSVEQMPSQAREGIAMLIAGASALKYGRQGKPHAVLAKLSSDLQSLSWERTGGLGSKLGALSKWGSGGDKARCVQLGDMVEILTGADSRVLQRFSGGGGSGGGGSNLFGKDGGGGVDERFCLSLVFASHEQGAQRDTLDFQLPDEGSFALWVAALYGLLALHSDSASDGGAAERAHRRELALARAAPALHQQLVAREEEAMAELRAQAEAEAQRQFEASRARTEALDRAQWEEKVRSEAEADARRNLAQAEAEARRQADIVQPLAGVFEAMPSYDAMPPGLPEPFADGLSLSLQMRAAAEAMQSGDMSALVALRAKLAQVEEENRRLREQGGGRRARKGGAAGGGAADDEEDEEDEQEVADRKTYERYEEAMDAVMAAFGRGVTPSSELYAARDLQLYRLSDSDLQAEYARYTAMYLDDDTSSAVRGMLSLIHI